ncbi:MAG: SMC-Scp complex subunit ScpB [Gammaproteobacteria bacterium]
MEKKNIRKIIEALIFSSASPISIKDLRNYFSDDNITTKLIEQSIEEIHEKYIDSGVVLKKVSTGYRFQIREEYNEWVSNFYPDKPQKYSRALMETLALIIYKQPITRTEIESVRGVSVSSNIIKTLLEREWIKILGYKDVPGKPAIFGTTKEFLNSHNLVSLSQLPKLDDIIELTKEDKEKHGLLDFEQNEDNETISNANNNEEYNNENIH